MSLTLSWIVPVLFVVYHVIFNFLKGFSLQCLFVYIDLLLHFSIALSAFIIGRRRPIGYRRLCNNAMSHLCCVIIIYIM